MKEIKERIKEALELRGMTASEMVLYMTFIFSQKKKPAGAANPRANSLRRNI